MGAFDFLGSRKCAVHSMNSDTVEYCSVFIDTVDDFVLSTAQFKYKAKYLFPLLVAELERLFKLRTKEQVTQHIFVMENTIIVSNYRK